MKIGVVLVTYNRLDKLKIALDHYDKQTYLPEYILVVNNFSNDGTQEFLNNWKKQKSKYQRKVLNLKTNTGGSGGFYFGLNESLQMDADWVWVSDDDAYPREDTFYIAQQYLNKKKKKINKISAICGTVYKSDGITIDCSHRRNIYKGALNIVRQPYSCIKDYKNNEFEINGFSYVGTMINVNIMKKIELTKKDYFIYYDDTEHSYRLSKLGKIICIPKMQIIHDAPHSDMKEIVKWKLYYLVRNTLDFIKTNFDEKTFNNSSFIVPLKFKIAVLFYGKTKKDGYAMINEAVKDAKISKSGLHDIYKPGWKPNEKKEK